MRRFFLIAGLLIGLAATGRTEGFSTSFVDVAVLDVPLGESHAVKDNEGHGIVFFNLGQQPLEITVRWRAPTAKELKRGAKPIPDIHWIRLFPETLQVAPGEQASAELQLEVPNHKAFAGQIYQVVFESFGAPTRSKGVRVQGALRSSLRFQTRKK
jgi:hypothetical protein